MQSYYTLETLNNRLCLLMNVLQYDTEQGKKLTISERTLINQERGAMMDYINYLRQELELKKVRTFIVPEPLEIKIQSIAKTIELRAWQPKPQEY